MSRADNERFQVAVTKNVSPGMSFVTAIEHLVKAGFSCDDRSSAPAISCSRSRNSILPFSCIQRVASDDSAQSDPATLGRTGGVGEREGWVA
jgi:hypothetical protein